MTIYLWINNANCSVLGCRLANGIHEIGLKCIIISLQLPLDFYGIFHFCLFLVKLTFFFFFCRGAAHSRQHVGISFPQLGMNLCPPAVEAQSVNHQISKEVPKLDYLIDIKQHQVSFFLNVILSAILLLLFLKVAFLNTMQKQYSKQQSEEVFLPFPLCQK